MNPSLAPDNSIAKVVATTYYEEKNIKNNIKVWDMRGTPITPVPPPHLHSYDSLSVVTV